MDFNANQMRSDALIKEGRYKFRVQDAREKRSTNGNDMINLKLYLKINGREVLYWDSLIFMPKMFWKVEHFCEATGLTDKIEQGRLMPQDCFDRQGYIDIIQKQDAQTGEMTNQTKDYVKLEDVGGEISQAETDDLFNDDIPSFT